MAMEIGGGMEDHNKDAPTKNKGKKKNMRKDNGGISCDDVTGSGGRGNLGNDITGRGDGTNLGVDAMGSWDRFNLGDVMGIGGGANLGDDVTGSGGGANQM
jgi:hypothetical protein